MELLFTGSDLLCIFKEPLNTKMQRKNKFTIKVMGKMMKLMMLADLHCCSSLLTALHIQSRGKLTPFSWPMVIFSFQMGWN